MALFGRKNAASDTEEEVAAPASQTAADDTDLIPEEESDTTGKLDLDAFADEFGAGASGTMPSRNNSLDAELEALNNPKEQDDLLADFSDVSGAEATDGPEPLDFNEMYEVEKKQAIATGKAPAPFVPASMAEAGIPEPETPFYDPQVALPVQPEPKKKLPLVPIIGLVAVLALGGGAALFFKGSSDSPNDNPITVASHPSNLGALTPVSPGTSTTLPKTRMIPTVPLTPQLQQQLKALWKQGAAAKRRGDYAGARAAWEKALKLRPNHPGFADSIAQLPPWG